MQWNTKMIKKKCIFKWKESTVEPHENKQDFAMMLCYLHTISADYEDWNVTAAHGQTQGSMKRKRRHQQFNTGRQGQRLNF